MAAGADPSAALLIADRQRDLPPNAAQAWSNWAQARATCQARGLDLASIPSMAMANELHKQIVARTSAFWYYVGGQDSELLGLGH
jgi:tryptophan synthase alpha subunit